MYVPGAATGSSNRVSYMFSLGGSKLAVKGFGRGVGTLLDTAADVLLIVSPVSSCWSSGFEFCLPLRLQHIAPTIVARIAATIRTMYLVSKLFLSESEELLMTVGSYVSLAPLFYYRFVRVIEMDNPGEVSQILRGITFDRNHIFDVGKSYL